MTESANYSVVHGDYRALEDANGTEWDIVDGKVFRDGVEDDTTANVDALAYVNGTIWQQAAPPWDPTHVYWWAWTGAGWGPAQDTNTASPLAGHPSPDGTTIPFDNQLIDQFGQIWWIADGKAIWNGQVDTATDRVIEMAWKNNTIYQENADQMWWAKTYSGFGGWGDTLGFANPVPVVRTWIGGDGNANDLTKWSPPQSPQPGDTLIMHDGIMDIADNELAGDTLTINNPTPVNLNLLPHGQSTFSIAAGNDGGIDYGRADITINMQSLSTWLGGMNIGPYRYGTITISDAHLATWANTDSSVDNHVIVGVPVTGDGSIHLYSAHGFGQMEFMHGVSAGQNLHVSGYELYGGQFGQAIADDVAAFQPNVRLDYGEIILKGLDADRASFANDMLTLSKAGAVVDTLRVHLGPDSRNFGVTEANGSVYIHADGTGVGGAGGPSRDWSDGSPVTAV